YRIIPNGIEYERFANSNISAFPKFTDGKFNILFVGRLEQRKGFRYLLQAIQLVQQHHNVRLLVVGGFKLSETKIYQQYIKKNGLKDIEFIGYVTPTELPRWYRTAHLLCAPSLGRESFGLILLEAMAAGLPIVASDIEGYRDVITHNVEGSLVCPTNVGALASEISRLICSPQLCAMFGLAGQEKASNYTWAKVTQNILDYYYELLTA
ncbi:MAG: glycosyltransferase family 4 protein, partial [Anaerolineales bacterium]